MFQTFESKVKLTIEILTIKQIVYYIRNTTYLYNTDIQNFTFCD